MNELLIDEKNIRDKIYVIRGKQVMLDRYLAELYECKNGTKTINQAVGRHLDKFPEDFYFQLTKKEFDNLKSQFGTSSWNNYGGVRKLPYAFTEEGVAMLSSVIRTKIASQINVSIMRAFVSMRHYITDNKDIFITLTNLNNKMVEYDEKLDFLFSKFESKEKIFLPGEEYDSYSYIFNILKDAKEEVIIMDPYADLNMLDMIRNINCNIILITSSKTFLSEKEINKFNKQYNKLKVYKNNKFHDRYFILDKNIMYHCGTSINYAGKRMFSINLLEDKFMKNNLFNFVKSII